MTPRSGFSSLSRLARFALLVASMVLMGCAPLYSRKAGVSLATYDTVYLGWLDLQQDRWALLGYAKEAEWKEEIVRQNAAFQSRAAEGLQGWRVVPDTVDGPAKVDRPGVSVRFSRVSVSTGGSIVTAETTFTDTASNRVLFVIPKREYHANGNTFGFANLLWYAIENLNKVVERELMADKR